MKLTPPAPSSTTAVFTEGLQRLLRDEPLPAFTDWFSARMLDAVQASKPVGPAELDAALRYQRHVARQLWAHVPVPSNRWRPRGLPKMERNQPCHCGSGRKFKQCCALFEHVDMPIPTDELVRLALDMAGPDMLTHEKVRQIPAQALGMAAMDWNHQDQPQKTLAVLAPLFAQANSLDERHETALDALIDAMQQLGQDRERKQLLEQLAQHSHPVLATAARCRLVSMLADLGEEERAWKLFHETTRLSPNDSQLWHLEMTLLLSQGRQDEAQLRAPLLAARARQAGMPELAQVIVTMAQQGLGAVAAMGNDDMEHEVHHAFLDLLQALPTALDTRTLSARYQVEVIERQEGGRKVKEALVQPREKMATLNRRWRRDFGLEKPNLTWLDTDGEPLLSELPEAKAFLQACPEAWLSTEVLDDLLLVAHALCEDNGVPPRVLQASRQLADHALALLRQLTQGAQLHWVVQDHRPLLRALAVAIRLARYAHDMPRCIEWMQWAMALNPDDNQGWRMQLVPLWLGQACYPEALDVLAQYPDDIPPSEHLRALALFGLGNTTEAEAVLRSAHQRYPLFLNTLLPESMEPPEDEPGPGIRVGGATSAWYHRLDCRGTWLRSGALAWAQSLQLPEPAAALKTPASKKPAKKRTPAASSKALGMQALSKPFGDTAKKRLQKTCSDYPRLQGMLQAVTWSPQVPLPSVWLPSVMDLHDRMPNSRTEATASKAMNDALGATMQLYNHLNDAVLEQQHGNVPPMDALLDTVGLSNEAVFAWAAGFLQGCELSAAAWARHGHKVAGHTGPFGLLRALAARAPVGHPNGRVQQSDGKPLLLALDDHDLSPLSSLVSGLAELWPVAAASRRGL